MSTTTMKPNRGEIWLVNLEPTVGAEIRKTRPVVVISSDAIGKLPIKLIAPITDWKPYFEENIWHIKIEPDSTNGLSKVSAIDTLQLRGLDTTRFIRQLGRISEEIMMEITMAIALVIEYTPD
ncbi:type II toxin-antitoxin system PemK/MazF family toxin [Pseudanabaena sp. CCNP1317]|nr:type II toxin-antitoxin system PemK/MazF family toxin [Pseudanabaena sp. CCNP1317]MEA5485749.1 type II toxin-antitoxin system PemK/MazF family toxin [Pseudanabaena sp. CCNP1317]